MRELSRYLTQSPLGAVTLQEPTAHFAHLALRPLGLEAVQPSVG